MSVFGTKLWGGNLFSGGQFTVDQFSDDLLTFNEYSLSDGSSIILRKLINPGPTREIIKGSIPRGDGEYVNGVFYRNRTITALCTLKTSTAALLNQTVDEIKKNLRTSQAPLDIVEEGLDPRRYYGICDNFHEMFDREHYHITFLPFVARFYCRPFGYDREYTSVMETVTTSAHNLIAETLGTVAAKPIFSLIFDSASSVTEVNIQRIDSDGNTLDEIEYTGSIATNDLLVFDGENNTVKLNQDEVNYVGAFPVLEPGPNIIKFTITSSSHSITATVSHRRTFL